MKFFNQWKKEVKTSAKEHSWYDLPSIRSMGRTLIVSGCLIVLSIPLGFFFGPWAAICGITAFIVLFLSFIISHRTPEGERLARQWKAFRRYLAKYRFQTRDRSEVLSHIDDYFVYGVLFGLSPKVYRTLAALIPEGEYVTFVPWYIYAGTARGFTPDTFATAFSSMISSTATTMSSATGTGGGASSGGGGGAGGGGGGAG
jgi:uncharacterized membrane protein